MAPAVSRRPHTADARVPHGLVHVRCMWDEEMGKTFVRVLTPCPIGIIPPLPHVQLHAIGIRRTSGLSLGIFKRKALCGIITHL